MEEVKRWSVTYTKHVKQKRKVYEDGFLELRSSTNKVILYDDCEKVLESRFVKKDDVIQSGEAIAFSSYLADIDHLQGDHKPIPNGNEQRMDNKIYEKSATFGTRRYKKGFSSPVILGKRKTEAPTSSLSPSQKIVREFKKKQMMKYSVSPSLPDTSKPADEWKVLYTTNVTQKAKKYHDGFIQLVPCGSQGRQIMLYDESRGLLNSRFLKKHEVIKSGESLSFDGYLVDIGECAAVSEPVTERDCNIVEKTGMLNNQSHHLIQSCVEFDVMYTIQRTKKYHYGILTLVPCGSYHMKATLLSEEGNTVSTIFLKSSSHNVKTGTSLQMRSYLLEVGELRKAFKGVCHYEGPQRNNVSSVDENVPTPTLTSAPVRAASDILNFIKKPAASIKEAAMASSSSKASHTEGLSLIRSEENFLKEELVQDFQSQPDDAMRCPSGEVVKIDDNAYDLKVTSLSRSPGSSNLSGATVTSNLRSREKLFDSSNQRPTSLITELQGISAPKVDSASEVSWKEKQTGQLPAAELCFKSSRRPKNVKVETIEGAGFGGDQS